MKKKKKWDEGDEDEEQEETPGVNAMKRAGRWAGPAAVPNDRPARRVTGPGICSDDVLLFFFFPFFFPHPPPLTLFLQSSSLFHRRGFFFWFSSRIKNKNKNKNKTKHNNLLKNEKGVWMPRRTLGSNGSFIWHRVIKRSKKRWNTKKIRLTRRVLNPPRPPNPPPTPPYFRYRSKSHRNQVRRRAESSLDLIGSLSLVFATGLFRNRSLFLKGKRKKKMMRIANW